MARKTLTIGVKGDLSVDTGPDNRGHAQSDGDVTHTIAERQRVRQGGVTRKKKKDILDITEGRPHHVWRNTENVFDDLS